MAKEKKKTMKSAVKANKVETTIKEPVKKITTEPEVKKIMAKPEAKKITVSKEPKKIAVAKEPEKIAVKPEPKKLTTKDTPKAKTIASTKKPTEKKITKKAETVKKAEITKKAASNKVSKKEEKAPAKKEVAKKTAVKNTPVKKETKAKKTTTTDTIEKMLTYTLDECISMLHTIGVMHSYDDYKKILLDESDLAIVEKNIITGNQLADATFDFEQNGFDIGLVRVTLDKVADTMDIKAKDYIQIKKAMNASVKTKLAKDDETNAKEYLNEFKTAEKLLMIGQRKNLTSSLEVSKLLGSDVDAFMKHFFDLAFEILPTWQYEDVKFYEDFAYAILSQYGDLYDSYQLRILIDCADLYIKHADFLHGDECYGYILRDNQIKDYIYYRFASIYETIDMNKAKGLAYEAMQYVDERFTYYPNILEILNK